MRRVSCREVIAFSVYLCIMIHFVYSAFPGDSEADSRHWQSYLRLRTGY